MQHDIIILPDYISSIKIHMYVCKMPPFRLTPPSQLTCEISHASHIQSSSNAKGRVFGYYIKSDCETSFVIDASSRPDVVNLSVHQIRLGGRFSWLECCNNAIARVHCYLWSASSAFNNSNTKTNGNRNDFIYTFTKWLRMCSCCCNC